MATYTDLAVFVLAGDPRNVSSPSITSYTTASVTDDGAGSNNTTASALEEYTYGAAGGGTQSVTINGITYDSSGRVGDDILNITSNGGGTIHSINGWIVELLDLSGTHPTIYAFFIETGETLPADISTNTTSYVVDSGGVNNGATMPYASVMVAAAGSDSIVSGTAGADSIDGTYTGDPDGDMVDNNDGNPNSATGNDDSITAGDGNDTINGGVGNDTILGEGGSDTFLLTDGFGNDSIVGGEDVGNTDTDVLNLSSLSTGAAIDLSANGATETESGTVTVGTNTATFSEIETIVGTNFSDTFTGSQGNDTIDGGAGNDSIYGGLGNDSILGGSGTDYIEGNDGQDTLDGGTGNDTLIGGAGADSISGGDGADLISSGEGANPVAGDTVDGGAGDDDIYFGGSDTVFGGTGDDEFHVDPASISGGTVTLDGGSDATDGNPDGTENGDAGDILNLGQSATGVDVVFGSNPETGTVNGLDGDADVDVSFTEIENVITTSQDDTVDAALAISGVNVSTGTGDDSVTGGQGNDTINLGTGADTVAAGAGDDSINLGDQDGDADVVVLTNGGGADTLTGVDGPTDNGDGTYTGIDTLDVSGLTHPTTGDPVYTTDVTITPDGAGNTTLTFPDGTSVTVMGTVAPTTDPTDPATENWLNAFGIPSEPNYIVEGTAGDDLIDGSYTGDPDGDMIDAGDGNPLTPNVGDGDSIVAGAGADTILAGSGDDTIVIEDSFGNDTIQGGESGETDGDILDASAMTSNVTLDLSIGEAADLPTRDLGGDLTFGDITVLRIDNTFTITGVETADIYDAGVDAYLGDETSTGLESYSNLGGQTGASVTLSNGETFTEFGQIITATIEVNGSTAEGYLVEAYTSGGSEYFFVPLRDVDTSFANTGDFLNPVVMGTTATTMFYADVSSPNNPESGTLSDGTSTATFTEMEQVILGSGDDRVIGSAGDDNVSTGAGADTVDGGAGNDTFDLGGADGVRDEVVLENGDGDDTITGFEAPLDNGDGTYTSQDQLNVTNLIDPTSGDPVQTTDVTITPDGSGNVTLTFPDGTSVTLQGLTAPTTDPTDPSTANWLNALGIPYAPNYIVEGTAAGELIDGSYTGDPEGDLVDAGDNQTGTDADVIDAGAGNDTIYGGLGDDTIYADEGDDEVYGGAGNDSILGFEGSDTVDGGDGNDYINTRTSTGTGVPDVGFVHPTDGTYSYPSDTDPNNDRDSVLGGAGDDTILTGDDADTIDGGDGADVISAGFDADLVSGGAGTDSIQGGEGADTIDGGDDDDIIYGGLSPLDPGYTESLNYEIADVDGDTNTTHNSDSLVGGAGNDRLYGQDDSDTLDGGVGNDTLDGGIDNDTLIGGTGDDVLTGGQGDDVFVYNSGDGADTITDFGAGQTGAITDGDQTNNDFVDLSGFYNDTTRADVNALTTGVDYANNLAMLRADAADGTLDGIIDGVDYSSAISGINLTLENGGSAVAAQDLTFDNTNVMCFTRGTLIKTILGDRPIEDLRQGDLIWTVDNGYQPIRWIGRRAITAAEIAQNGKLRPIRIKAGALGDHLPRHDLMVSPQHRMVINSKIAQRLSGDAEVLVPAHKLVLLDGIDVAQDLDQVDYWHMLFDRHEIVDANGALSESLFTGPEALKTVDADAKQEILALFPELADMSYTPEPARPIVSGRQARKIAARHQRNGKRLFQ